jgi:hypothetical protein
MRKKKKKMYWCHFKRKIVDVDMASSFRKDMKGKVAVLSTAHGPAFFAFEDGRARSYIALICKQKRITTIKNG